MKMSDALAGVNTIGVDSAPIIYLVEKHPTYFDRVAFVFRQLSSSDSIRAVGSMLTITEVLSHPLKRGATEIVQQYEEILSNSTNFDLRRLNRRIARRAAELRAAHGLRTPDAIHLATAIDAGCEAFLTNDRGLLRVTDLRVLVLDELELDLRQPNK